MELLPLGLPYFHYGFFLTSNTQIKIKNGSALIFDDRELSPIINAMEMIKEMEDNTPGQNND